jgi:hypothetical protein
MSTGSIGMLLLITLSIVAVAKAGGHDVVSEKR